MVERSDVKRPLLRYFGGKWQLKNWILKHLPEHRFYAEPFCGGASILLAKQPAPGGEIINDLNSEVINLFRVMQDQELSSALIEKLKWTPYAQSELITARSSADDAVEKARRMVIRSFMGITPSGHEDNNATGIRMGNVTLSTYDQEGKRTFRNCAKDWQSWKDNLEAIRKRLECVMIYENDALDFIRLMDAGECLQYVDPPYCYLKRSDSRYVVEFQKHQELVNLLLACKSKFVVSGYDSEAYLNLELAGWTKVEKDYRANMSTTRRRECLWISPNR